MIIKKIVSYDNLIGQKLIYNEKSILAICELVSADLVGTYQEFNLKVLEVLNDGKLNVQNGEELELGFETEYITYDHNIITASYYMTWRLIFNQNIINEFHEHKSTQDLPLWRYLRKLMDEVLYQQPEHKLILK